MRSIITLEKFNELKQQKNMFYCRFLPRGILTYVNELCRQELNGNEGDNFVKLLPPLERERFMNHICSFTPDVPIKQHIEEVYGRKLMWINRAIFDGATGALIEFESVGQPIQIPISLTVFNGNGIKYAYL